MKHEIMIEQLNKSCASFRLLDMLRCAKFDPIVKLSVVVRSFRPLVTFQYHAAVVCGVWGICYLYIVYLSVSL